MHHITNRLIYLFILVIIIGLGLYSRDLTGRITEMIDVKDVAWAMMVYFLFRIVFPGGGFIKIIILSALFSLFIEVSQLFHAEWLDKIRETLLGQIILGSSFVWGDLWAYAVGIGIAVVIDILVSILFIRR
jgi:hypothetical protein